MMAGEEQSGAMARHGWGGEPALPTEGQWAMGNGQWAPKQPSTPRETINRKGFARPTQVTRFVAFVASCGFPYPSGGGHYLQHQEGIRTAMANLTLGRDLL